MNQSGDVLQTQITHHLFEKLIKLNTCMIYEKMVLNLLGGILSSVVGSTRDVILGDSGGCSPL